MSKLNTDAHTSYIKKDMMRKILTIMIRPKLEYAEVIGSPHKKKSVLTLERIKRTATKMVPELEDLRDNIVRNTSNTNINKLKSKVNNNI